MKKRTGRKCCLGWMIALVMLGGMLLSPDARAEKPGNSMNMESPDMEEKADLPEEIGETEEEAIRREARDSFDHFVEINGRSFYFYAQNNPVFFHAAVLDERLTVCSSTCAPTSLANVIINTADQDHLDRLSQLAVSPVRVDRRSVMNSGGLNTEKKFVISRPEDVIQFLPVYLINIIAGNNNFASREYRNTGYYDQILDLLGLEYEKTRDLHECLDRLKTHEVLIVTCSGGSESPLSNTTGHYFVMADMDDEYVYFFDSIARDEYPLDKRGIIEILSPGFIRCRAENVRQMCLTGTKFIVRRQENNYGESR